MATTVLSSAGGGGKGGGGERETGVDENVVYEEMEVFRDAQISTKDNVSYFTVTPSTR